MHGSRGVEVKEWFSSLLGRHVHRNVYDQCEEESQCTMHGFLQPCHTKCMMSFSRHGLEQLPRTLRFSAIPSLPNMSESTAPGIVSGHAKLWVATTGIAK